MNRTSRMLTLLLTLLVLAAAVPPVHAAPAQDESSAVRVAQPPRSTADPVAAEARPSPVAQAETETGDEIFPLPKGCGGVTPPGTEEAACCISGFVYIDGQIIAGAEVRVQSQRGEQVVAYTQVYSGTEARPYFQLSLSAEPLNVVAGETITVTGRYSSHERSVVYRVQPGSQQVDVVLGRNQADDYVFERQIWGQAEPGKFNNPRGVVVGKNGNIYGSLGIAVEHPIFSRALP